MNINSALNFLWKTSYVPHKTCHKSKLMKLHKLYIQIRRAIWVEFKAWDRA